MTRHDPTDAQRAAARELLATRPGSSDMARDRRGRMAVAYIGLLLDQLVTDTGDIDHNALARARAMRDAYQEADR